MSKAIMAIESIPLSKEQDFNGPESLSQGWLRW